MGLRSHKLISISLAVFHIGILGQCVPPGGAHEAHLLSCACLAGYEVQCALIEQTKNLKNGCVAIYLKRLSTSNSLFFVPMQGFLHTSNNQEVDFNGIVTAPVVVSCTDLCICFG